MTISCSLVFYTCILQRGQCGPSWCCLQTTSNGRRKGSKFVYYFQNSSFPLRMPGYARATATIRAQGTATTQPQRIVQLMLLRMAQVTCLRIMRANSVCGFVCCFVGTGLRESSDELTMGLWWATPQGLRLYTQVGKGSHFFFSVSRLHSPVPNGFASLRQPLLLGLNN